MHDTEDPTQSSAATAAGTAADYSARATYARGWEDAIRARDEVGIQYAAAQAMIARMQPVVAAARVVADHAADLRVGLASLRRSLRALDTVPGDALGRP